MESWERVHGWVPERLWEVRATVALLLLASVVYGLQLLVMNGPDSTAAWRFVQQYLAPNAGVHLFVSPFVHSSHAHLLGNLLWLGSAGYVAERRFDSVTVGVFVYAAGVLSNIAPSLLGVGGGAVGISGAFYGLWTLLFLVSVMDLGEELRSERDGARLVWLGLAAFVGVLFAVTGIGQAVGLLSVGAGVSKAGHLFGIFMGAAWFLTFLLDLDAGPDVNLGRA